MALATPKNAPEACEAPVSPPASSAIFSRESPNLDFLRAFAVLCVFLRHILAAQGDPSGPWFQPQALGIFGVMAFFVHTSLVLMFSLERQFQGRKIRFSDACLTFFVRRAFRVYPLSATVVLLAWFVLPTAMSHAGEIAEIGGRTWSTLLANLMLTNNLVHRPYVIGTLWTLPLELQMYLFLPALFLLARRLSPAAMMAVWPLVAAMAYLCRYKLHLPEVFGYTPCFFAGIVAYRLFTRSKPTLPFWSLPVLLVGILGAYMALYARFHAETPLGWFVCLSLGVTLPHVSSLRPAWLAHPSKMVAKYSYGIYLTHTFAIYLAFNALPLDGLAARIVASALLTTVFSVASFHLIESPMIVLGARLARMIEHRRTLTLDDAPAP